MITLKRLSGLLAHFYPVAILKLSYFGFFSSHLNYIIPLCDNSNKESIKKVFRLGKQVIRIMTHLSLITIIIFKKLSILTFLSMYILEIS